jgi:tetratricopeptide (TPR) repeat protein
VSPHDHPDEAVVLRYLAGEAREHARAIEEHVDVCIECREWMAQLARTSLGVASSASAPDDDPIALGEFLPRGATIGRFTVVRMLGRGGAGAVYQVADTQLDRQLAIKVLRHAVAGTSATRLLAEARTMARFSDPHVCQVFDVGSVDGRWFIVMQLVSGGTLAQWLAAGERSPEHIVEVFTQAARGLHAAHRIGVVHRDFKPSNVLMADGRAVVSDFGLAASEQDTTSASGGTPHYMAPEQREGGGDARVDQFAWAVALRDALGDREPPRALRAVLERARAHAPEQRYPDMAALLAALARAGRPRAGRGVPLALLGGAALAIALVLPAASGEPATVVGVDEQPRLEVSHAVQLLLDRSIDDDRANDPHAMLQVIDQAVALAEATGDRAGLALSLAARGSQLGKLGRAPEAIDELERAFNLANEIDRPDFAADAAIIRVGLLAEDAARPDEAMIWGRHVESTLMRMEGVDDRVLSDFDAVIGRAHFIRGELGEARDRYRRAVDRLREQSPRLDRHLVGMLMLLGLAEQELGEHAEARVHMEASVRLGTEVLGADHPDVAGAYGNLAIVDAAAGDIPAALEHLARARRSLVASYGAHHPNVLAIDASVSALMLRTDRVDEAAALIERALAGAPERLPITCRLHEGLAITLARRQRIDEARARFHVALDCYQALFGPDSAQAADAELGLAELAPKR